MATHEDYDESGRGCFRRFCFGGDKDEGRSYLLGDEEAGKPEWWLVAKLKKVRELSEVVAGPKWKNLIRKMGRICNSRKTAVESRYSPESYALNFSGADEQLLHSFSTRFASGSFINDHQRRQGL